MDIWNESLWPQDQQARSVGNEPQERALATDTLKIFPLHPQETIQIFLPDPRLARDILFFFSDPNQMLLSIDG